MSLIFLFTGCFAGFLTDYLSYQALNYEITEPRVLAVRTDPLYLLSGDFVEIDALIVAPKEDEIRSHRISVCGLGHATQTSIWNLSCFEDDAEVSVLGIGMLPMRVQIPQIPEIDCDDRFEYSPPMDSGIVLEDSGFPYAMQHDPCSHNLPLLIESNVLEEVGTRKEQTRSIYGGDYATWYSSSPDNNNIPIARRHHEILYETTARSGDEIEIQWVIDGKLPQASFHWYVDKGMFLNTGLTTGSFVSTNQDITEELDGEDGETIENFDIGTTVVQNTLRIDADFEGTLRFWVVAHYNWNSLMDMAWTEGTIEVSR